MPSSGQCSTEHNDSKFQFFKTSTSKFLKDGNNIYENTYKCTTNKATGNEKLRY
jgi:hypothetical protein